LPQKQPLNLHFAVIFPLLTPNSLSTLAEGSKQMKCQNANNKQKQKAKRIMDNGGGEGAMAENRPRSLRALI